MLCECGVFRGWVIGEPCTGTSAFTLEGLEAPQCLSVLEDGVETGRWDTGPGAGTRSGGAQGKSECLHNPLGFLEVPFVHPEMSCPCFPGWGPPCNVTYLLSGMECPLLHASDERPDLESIPVLSELPFPPFGVRSPGQALGGWRAHPGCRGDTGPSRLEAAGSRPLPSSGVLASGREGGREGARRADGQL